MLTGCVREGRPGFILVTISALLIPLFDVVRVALHRIRRHRNPFKPDRNHIHHKLLRSGMKMRWVLATIIAMDVFYILLNWYMNKYLNITVILFIDLVLWGILHLCLNKRI